MTMRQDRDASRTRATGVQTRGRLWRLLLATFLVATALTAGALVTTPRVATDDVPAEESSAARAMQYLAVVAAEPHPMGSPAQQEVRDYLVSEGRSLGLPVEVQRDEVSGPENVIVRLNGTADTDRDVLITSHYDSAPGTPGAGDNGISVAAMVETMRVLHAADPSDNDVVLLFTDGEEQGQTGIVAFLADHPAAGRVGVAFAFEALPESGGTELRTTTPGDAWLIGELADASLPVFTTSANNSSDRERIGNDFAAFAVLAFVGSDWVTAVLLGVAAVPTLVVAVPLLMLEALDVEEGTMVAVPILLLLLGSLLPTLRWLGGRLEPQHRSLP